MRANKPLLHGDITASIIDSFFEVHKELGFGYREYIYTRALERLLIAKGHKVEREVAVMVRSASSFILARRPASIASSSKIGSSNETSGARSCRCRAVSVDRSIAVSRERCLSIANVGPTGAAGL